MLSVSKTLFKIVLLCIILASLGDAPRIFALEEEKIEQLKKKSDGIREQIEKEKALVGWKALKKYRMQTQDNKNLP